MKAVNTWHIIASVSIGFFVTDNEAKFWMQLEQLIYEDTGQRDTYQLIKEKEDPWRFDLFRHDAIDGENLVARAIWNKRKIFK